MEPCLKSRKSHVFETALVILGILCLINVVATENCRKHSAVLTDFGGVGDGKTLNTKAFKDAIDHLSKLSSDGGAKLVVPPGKWLTGSFNLTSRFTLFLDKEATILATENESEWPQTALLPSYGKGTDKCAPDARYISFIFGTNLTDVVITGNNGSIDGQGRHWWNNFRERNLKATRPNLIEIMYSDRIQISNISLYNSPAWNVHPIYSSNVVIEKVTISAPIDARNSDGIIPDSCTNVRIKDCIITAGRDCISIKSGWNQYGIKFGMPTKNVVIEKLTCMAQAGSAISLGSEMSGGIENVRVNDIATVNTFTGFKVHTVPGRGGYIRNIFAKKMNFVFGFIRYAIWFSSLDGEHPDDGYNRRTLSDVENISLSGIKALNVYTTANLGGLAGHSIKGICVSDAKFLALEEWTKRQQWFCSDLEGVTSSVNPKACDLLPEKPGFNCPYPLDRLPIENVPLKTC
ncbi:hypothetical protein UlMin_024488 [Ulmus minor]